MFATVQKMAEGDGVKVVVFGMGATPAQARDNALMSAEDLDGMVTVECSESVAAQVERGVVEHRLTGGKLSAT